MPASADLSLEHARRVGRRLRELRLRAGLTQRQLAEPRYTSAYVSSIENGLARPSLRALIYFGDSLGLPPAELLSEEPLPAGMKAHHPDWRRVGQRIAGLRHERGLDQGRLARMLGWTQARLSKIEVGRHRLSFLDAVHIARTLEVSLEVLTPDADDGSQPAADLTQRGGDRG